MAVNPAATAPQPQTILPHPTQPVLQAIGRIDGDDNQSITKAEVETSTTSLNDQLDKLGQNRGVIQRYLQVYQLLNFFFFGALSGHIQRLQQFEQQIQGQLSQSRADLDVNNFITEHFDKLASTDKIFGDGKADEINERDIHITSRRDGKPEDISEHDLTSNFIPFV